MDLIASMSNVQQQCTINAKIYNKDGSNKKLIDPFFRQISHLLRKRAPDVHIYIYVWYVCVRIETSSRCCRGGSEISELAWNQYVCNCTRHAPQDFRYFKAFKMLGTVAIIESQICPESATENASQISFSYSSTRIVTLASSVLLRRTQRKNACNNAAKRKKIRKFSRASYSGLLNRELLIVVGYPSCVGMRLQVFSRLVERFYIHM